MHWPGTSLALGSPHRLQRFWALQCDGHPFAGPEAGSLHRLQRLLALQCDGHPFAGPEAGSRHFSQRPRVVQCDGHPFGGLEAGSLHLLHRASPLQCDGHPFGGSSAGLPHFLHLPTEADSPYVSSGDCRRAAHLADLQGLQRTVSARHFPLKFQQPFRLLFSQAASGKLALLLLGCLEALTEQRRVPCDAMGARDEQASRG